MSTTSVANKSLHVACQWTSCRKSIVRILKLPEQERETVIDRIPVIVLTAACLPLLSIQAVNTDSISVFRNGLSEDYDHWFVLRQEM